MAFAFVALGCTGGDREDAESSGTSVGSRIPATVDSLLAPGKRLYEDGNYDSARAHFVRILSRFRRNGDSIGVAMARTEAGLAAYRLGDFEMAKQMGEAALRSKRRLGLREELFRSYNALGLLARQEGRYPDAIEYFQAAFDAARATDDSASIAKVACNLGLVRMTLGDYAGAREGCRTAATVAGRLGETRTEGRALANLATLEIGTGSPARGLELLRKARITAERAGDEAALAYIAGEFAPAYSALGQPDRAIAHLDSALAASRELGFRQDEASNLELLAEIHRQAGRPRRALQLFADARAIDEELGLTKRLADNYRSEAIIFAEVGDLERARERAERALAVHRSLGARSEILGDLVVLADLLSRAGNAEKAGHRLREAERLAAELDTRSARLSVALAGARAAEQSARPERVLQILDAAADDLQRASSGTEVEALALRGRALRRLGRLDSAIAVGRRAIDAVDRARMGYGSSQLRASVQARHVDVYGDLVEALLAAGAEEEAFEVADAARGHALLEHLQVSNSDELSTVAARELAEGQVLLAQIDSLLTRLEGLDALPPDERTAGHERLRERYEARLERARSSYEAGLLRLTREDPGSATLLGARHEKIDQIQQALGVDEALLEYMLGPERVVLFVLTREEVTAVPASEERKNLSSRVRVVRELISAPDGNSPEPAAAMEELHEILIEPAIRTGMLEEIRRLVIVPQGELQYLPFAALRNAADDRYLIERFEIMHLSAASALPVLRQRESAASEEVVTASSFAPFPEELPATRAELDAFQRVTGGRVYEGSAADEPALREALLARAIVHVATHGVLNIWNPMFSRIELAVGRESVSRSDEGFGDDGRLEVHELLYMTIHSPLVFLSGCDTGVGSTGSTQFGGGQDYATLAQAFLYAGADNVIATLWRVEDEGAAYFARRFFEGLADTGPVAALAHAQRETLAEPRFARPFYWAGYRLDGSGRSPPGSDGGSFGSHPQNRGRMTVVP